MRIVVSRARLIDFFSPTKKNILQMVQLDNKRDTDTGFEVNNEDQFKQTFLTSQQANGNANGKLQSPAGSKNALLQGSQSPASGQYQAVMSPQGAQKPPSQYQPVVSPQAQIFRPPSSAPPGQLPVNPFQMPTMSHQFQPIPAQSANPLPPQFQPIPAQNDIQMRYQQPSYQPSMLVGDTNEPKGKQPPSPVQTPHPSKSVTEYASIPAALTNSHFASPQGGDQEIVNPTTIERDAKLQYQAFPDVSRPSLRKLLESQQQPSMEQLQSQPQSRFQRQHFLQKFQILDTYLINDKCYCCL